MSLLAKTTSANGNGLASSTKEIHKDQAQRNNLFPYTLNAFPFLISDDPKRHEHKTRAFGFIFGFLASLAITNALRTYYDQYIKVLTGLAIPALVKLASENPLPSMRLISFFAVAVPLAHSGYIFLSSLNLASVRYIIEEKEKDKDKEKKTEKPPRRLITKGSNTAAGLVAIFIISIIQVGFLFLLGSSLANLSEHESDKVNSIQAVVTTSEQQSPKINATQAVENQYNQSRAFLFWMTLTTIASGVGLYFIKVIIENNRIPTEWIMLYAFTVGFLLTTLYLPILELEYSTRL